MYSKSHYLLWELRKICKNTKPNFFAKQNLQQPSSIVLSTKIVVLSVQSWYQVSSLVQVPLRMAVYIFWLMTSYGLINFVCLLMLFCKVNQRKFYEFLTFYFGVFKNNFETTSGSNCSVYIFDCCYNHTSFSLASFFTNLFEKYQ